MFWKSSALVKLFSDIQSKNIKYKVISSKPCECKCRGANYIKNWCCKINDRVLKDQNFLFPNGNRWHYKYYTYTQLEFLHVLSKLLEATLILETERERNCFFCRPNCLHSCYLFDFSEDIQVVWCCSIPNVKLTTNGCS